MEDNHLATTIQSRWRGYVTRSRNKIYVDSPPNGHDKDKVRSVGSGEIPIFRNTGKLENVPELVSPPSEGSLQTSSAKSRGRLLEPPRTPPPKMNECVLPTDSTKKEKVPYARDYDVEIIIDEAMGLPLTTTVTRVHARLHMPTKEDQRDCSTFAYSDLTSDYTNPRFGFAVKWRGKYLHQTMTILIRIDTLESPNLEPKTIGFCALRLCIDTLGMQPLSEVLFDGKPSCFFNTGEFLVPILYGVFPNDIPFITEAKFQESLPPIPNAFVKIKLNATKGIAVPSTPTASTIGATNSFDINNQQSSRRLSMLPLSHKQPSVPVLRMSSAIFLDVSNSPKSGKGNNNDNFHLFSKSVASIILKTYLSMKINDKTKLLVIDTNVIDNFRKGNNIDFTQRQLALRMINTYIAQCFENEDQPKEAISSKYLLEYSEEYGALAGLDMLWNMPDRRKLIQAAERAASVAAMKSGMSGRWDNKINCFKTVFRYLPGALSSTNRGHESNGIEYKDREVSDKAAKGVQEQAESLVIDDASVKLSLNSVEQCPAYLDEFSCTVGMKLGPRACLLIIVNAVDVLTSRRAASTKSMEDITGPSLLSPSSSRASLFSGEDYSTKNDRVSRAQKLKGLRGIHSGYNDPKATWWGLVPLFTKFPSAYITTETALPHRDHSEAMTMQGSENPNTGATDPIEATLSSLSSLPLFVNYGTHQIPLFQGIPPDEMINASDPLAWVMSRLNYQVSRVGDDQAQTGMVLKMLMSLGGCFVSNKPSGVDADMPISASASGSSKSTKNSKRSKKSKKKKTEDILLSSGCSAFIRIVDPRIKRLAGSPLSVDTTREFNTEGLVNILNIQSHYAVDDKGILSLQMDNNKLRSLKNEFQFQPNKYNGKRTIRMAIPESVDPQYLIQELNSKFYQSLST
eukprot:gene3574-3820_t